MNESDEFLILLFWVHSLTSFILLCALGADPEERHLNDRKSKVRTLTPMTSFLPGDSVLANSLLSFGFGYIEKLCTS